MNEEKIEVIEEEKKDTYIFNKKQFLLWIIFIFIAVFFIGVTIGYFLSTHPVIEKKEAKIYIDQSIESIMEENKITGTSPQAILDIGTVKEKKDDYFILDTKGVKKKVRINDNTDFQYENEGRFSADYSKLVVGSEVMVIFNINTKNAYITCIYK